MSVVAGSDEFTDEMVVSFCGLCFGSDIDLPLGTGGIAEVRAAISAWFPSSSVARIAITCFNPLSVFKAFFSFFFQFLPFNLSLVVATIIIRVVFPGSEVFLLMLLSLFSV